MQAKLYVTAVRKPCGQEERNSAHGGQAIQVWRLQLSLICPQSAYTEWLKALMCFDIIEMQECPKIGQEVEEVLHYCPIWKALKACNGYCYISRVLLDISTVR